MPASLHQNKIYVFAPKPDMSKKSSKTPRHIQRPENVERHGHRPECGGGMVVVVLVVVLMVEGCCFLTECRRANTATQ